MQDRFKFRVWHKRRKKMYDVLCLHAQTWSNGGEWVTVKGFNIITQQNIHIQVQPKDCILMQCTGLKDKNGKLIYEGDIVKIWKFSKDLHGNDKRIIKWNDARCGFRLYTIDEYKRGMELCPQSMVNVTTIEVIGNVYENSELLERNNDKTTR